MFFFDLFCFDFKNLRDFPFIFFSLLIQATITAEKRALRQQNSTSNTSALVKIETWTKLAKRNENKRRNWAESRVCESERVENGTTLWIERKVSGNLWSRLSPLCCRKSLQVEGFHVENLLEFETQRRSLGYHLSRLKYKIIVEWPWIMPSHLRSPPLFHSICHPMFLLPLNPQGQRLSKNFLLKLNCCCRSACVEEEDKK